MDYFLSDEALIGLCMVVVTFFSFFTTALVRSYSLRHSLIDKPNERSSHTIPTPRGGGFSISISIIACIIILTAIDWLSINIAIAMAGGGILVVIVGWIDDHKNIAAVWRGILYLIAAIWAVYYVGGLERIKFGESHIYIGLLGSILAIVGITWLTNLYNFMDGTDALASVQAISTGTLAGILLWSSNQYGLAIVCFVIVASSSGFLIWNWPPAKIFMGDVCSCLIGFIFGVLAIAGENTNSVHINIWIILLAVFIWDATLTLIKRVVTGEKWYTAHRSHSYQRLTQLGVSHSKLAILTVIFNVVILWPTAYAAYKWEQLSLYMVIFSSALMSILWLTIQLYYWKQVVVLQGVNSE